MLQDLPNNIIINILNYCEYSSSLFTISKTFNSLCEIAFDPTRNDNRAIRWATMVNDTRITKRLLRDKRVVEAMNFKEVIQKMFRCDNYEIFKQLIKDRRANSELLNEFLRISCQGSLRMVKILLNNKKVNGFKHAFSAALVGDNHLIIREFINRKKIDLYSLNRFLIESIMIGKVYSFYEIMKESQLSLDGTIDALHERYNYKIAVTLLHDKRTDFSKAQVLIDDACENNNIELLRELLEHPEIDPSLGNNEYLIRACEQNKIEIIKMLLKNQSVQLIFDRRRCIQIAYKYQYIELYNFLNSTV